MTRWQHLAETNPSASPEQQTLLGLMVVAELENSASPESAVRDPGSGGAAPPAPTPLAKAH